MSSAAVRANSKSYTKANRAAYCTAYNSNKRAKSKKNIKKSAFRFFASIAIVALIAVCVLVLNQNTIQADESIEYNKYFKSVEIKTGDTIWSIAEENIPENSSIDIREYIEEVQQINSLNGDNITSGMNIVVPYYAE